MSAATPATRRTHLAAGRQRTRTWAALGAHHRATHRALARRPSRFAHAHHARLAPTAGRHPESRGHGCAACRVRRPCPCPGCVRGCDPDCGRGSGWPTVACGCDYGCDCATGALARVTVTETVAPDPASRRHAGRRAYRPTHRLAWSRPEGARRPAAAVGACRRVAPGTARAVQCLAPVVLRRCHTREDSRVAPLRRRQPARPGRPIGHPRSCNSHTRYQRVVLGCHAAHAATACLLHAAGIRTQRAAHRPTPRNKRGTPRTSCWRHQSTRVTGRRRQPFEPCACVTGVPTLRTPRATFCASFRVGTAAVGVSTTGTQRKGSTWGERRSFTGR